MPPAESTEDLLARVYNAFNPREAATPEFYTNMDQARGTDGALVREFLRHVTLARNKYVKFLFSGHIGSGKSSELHHLQHSLEQRAANSTFLPVLVDTNDYLTDYDADAIDLLLAVLAELGDTLRSKLQLDLADGYLTRRFNEFRGLMLSDVELGDGEVGVSDVKVTLKRLKSNDTARQKVREALRPQVSTILDEVNSLLLDVRAALRKHPSSYTDIVLIIDNLEKIRKVPNAAEGYPSQRELFLEQYTKLTGFNAHVIYTTPLRLVRSEDAPQLMLRYDGVFVLPMVKVIQRDRSPYDAGIKALEQMIARRIAPSRIEEVFAPEALQFMLEFCGGHVRHLVLLIRAACAQTTALPFDLEAAQRAVQQLVRSFAVSIAERHWSKLAAVERSADHKIENGDPDYLALLENAAILEYLNGDGEDFFASAEPWYAVHPVVRKLQRFRQALGEAAPVT